MRGKDFLSIAELSPEALERLIQQAVALKKEGSSQRLAGKALALLFEKPSLRTRVSFEVAMRQLGGYAIYLSPAEVGLGQREPVSDVARALSRYVDGIAARTFAHVTLEELARYATIPVINALSDHEHPCQALGDLLTIYEKKGKLRGLTLAFIGDGNNVTHSLLLACSLAGMNFRMAVPSGYEPKAEVVEAAWERAHPSGASLFFTQSPPEAVQGADIIYTDVWTSMGQEAEREERQQAFAGYQVNLALIAQAPKGALVMHDLPAHRGEEITDAAINSPQSVIFDQAENRLHAQKAVLVELLAR